MERIEGLYFAEGEEEGYLSYDIAAKEFDKDGCIDAVRELIADIILNNVKLQFILTSLGKRAIDTSLCTLISSMLYYDNKKEEEYVKNKSPL